jgi:hypothetical protein
MSKGELIKWLGEYEANLLSLMGQDDYVTGKLDVINEVIDRLDQEDELDKLLKLERDLSQMFDSDTRIALALLEEIRKIKRNEEV